MNHKKIVYTSLLIGLLYLVLSFAYLHSGFAFAHANNSRSETNLKIVIEFILLVPAITIDEILKKQPDQAKLYLSLLIYFIILSILSSGVIYLYKLIKK